MTKHKHARGEGSTFKSGNYWYAKVNGKKTRCKTEAQANKARVEMVRQATVFQDIADSRITFNKYVKRYEDVYITPNTPKGSTLNYKQNILKYIYSYAPLQNIRMTTLKEVDIQRFFNEMVLFNGHTPSKSTKKKVKSLLQQILRQAVKERMIPYNYAEDTLITGTVSNEKEALTIEQLRALETTARGHKLFPLLRLLTSMGLRIGEATALTWQDIDFKTGMLNIDKSYSKVDTTFAMGDTKTPKSKRVIKIPLETLDCLKRAYILRDTSTNYISPVSYLKVKTEKTPVNADNFRRWLKSLCEKAGVPVIPAHILRHTFITIAYYQGVPLKDIATYVGHSTTRMTIGTYTHARKDTAGVADKMNEALYLTA